MKKPHQKAISQTPFAEYGGLIGGIAELLGGARRTAARTINALMTATYWEIGRRIVEFEQKGAARAGYGEQILSKLSHDLTVRFGRGFGVDNLQRFRSFFLSYPTESIHATLSRKLPVLPVRSQTPPRKSPSGKSESPIRKMGVEKYATASRPPDCQDLCNASARPRRALLRRKKRKNGATGRSDIEGKAVRVAASDSRSERVSIRNALSQAQECPTPAVRSLFHLLSRTPRKPFDRSDGFLVFSSDGTEPLIYFASRCTLSGLARVALTVAAATESGLRRFFLRHGFLGDDDFWELHNFHRRSVSVLTEGRLERQFLISDLG